MTGERRMQQPSGAVPIRAHVVGCLQTLRVPVDRCACGGRAFLTDHQRRLIQRRRKSGDRHDR